jgi:hypothetical protein
MNSDVQRYFSGFMRGGGATWRQNRNLGIGIAIGAGVAGATGAETAGAGVTGTAPDFKKGVALDVLGLTVGATSPAAGAEVVAPYGGFDASAIAAADFTSGGVGVTTGAPGIWSTIQGGAKTAAEVLGIANLFKSPAPLNDSRGLNAPITPTFAFSPEASDVTPANVANAKANQQLLQVALLVGAIIAVLFLLKKG